MRTRDVLFAALRANPADDTARLALADFLEEEGQPDRAELMRLLVGLRLEPESSQASAKEQRIRELLASGVEPCVVETVNSVGMRFALVPPGTFWMGSPETEAGRFPEDEGPQHRVTITRPFWMGVYAVTQEQYREVMGVNPSAFQSDGGDAEAIAGVDSSSFPVDSVSWAEACSFCRALTLLPRERLAGREYRLPTEAEWEYACRRRFTDADACPILLRPRIAGCTGPVQRRRRGRPSVACLSSPSRGLPANVLGLYDMHGNVWEWCQDWFNETYYADGPPADPPGPDFGKDHVLRGGSWYSPAHVRRCACRAPIATANATGFRILLEHRV